MDTDALKRTWALAEQAGPEMPLYFYSHLFLTHPELRAMFPVSMATQRDRLVAALGRIVSQVDDLDNVVGYIQQLGRDHRRFDVIAEHYDAVGASLLAALQRYLGDEWTPSVAADWATAYGLIAQVMIDAADASATTTPAAWHAEVTSIERRTLDIAVLQLRLDAPYDYRPGQSFAVETPHLPRLWRYYSPANAPRPDGSIELHVQLVPGGQVSGALVRLVKPGDLLRVGAAVGDVLTLPDDNDRDLLMVAGSTGLAPLRAHLEAIDQRSQSGAGPIPRVRLLHGARMPWNLYEHELLSRLANRAWFEYTPVVSEDPGYDGERGLVGSIAARFADPSSHLALVCGSPGMVQHSVQQLRDAGLADDSIRHEQYGSLHQNDSFQLTESGHKL